jgi:hypothetical protein
VTVTPFGKGLDWIILVQLLEGVSAFWHGTKTLEISKVWGHVLASFSYGNNIKQGGYIS